MNEKMSVILLAGGQGIRFGSAKPKQFLELCAKPIALYSYELFCQRQDVREIVVVCAPAYRSIFQEQSCPIEIKFALPGKRRQDSVYNGMQTLDGRSEFVCIHDAARPFISSQLIDQLILTAREYGAAAPAVPIKFTIKETDPDLFVKRTLDRSSVWEIQTPQILQPDLLQKGFAYVNYHHLNVTDDISLAEIVGSSPKLVQGEENNLKITTPLDFYIAERLLQTEP